MSASKADYDDADQSELFSDNESEYRDVVADVDYSRAMVKVADDFLDGKDEGPLLAITGPDDYLDTDKFDSYDDDTKSMGGVSRASGMSKLSDRNFVNINKSA